MQKPNNYDNTNIGQYVPVQLGGHHCIIKGVHEQQSKTGKSMIVVAIDFAANDVQPGYFMDSFEKDIRPEKKWPFQGTQYIVCTNNDGNTSKSFKSFITCVERSNQGFITAWGDNFCEQFTGKAIGAVFGNVEEEYNGKVTKRARLRWFCEDSRVDDANIPEEKLIDKSSAQEYPGFTSVADSDLPF